MEDHKHNWKQEYYGIRCTVCDLFYPDNSNWFAPQDDEDEDFHSYGCTCEGCLQNHPERDILYGDGEYFNWTGLTDDEAAKQSVQQTCPTCRGKGKVNVAGTIAPCADCVGTGKSR